MAGAPKKSPPPKGKAAVVRAKPRPKAKSKSKGQATKTPGGIWTWKTPDEGWKLRLALGLIILLLGAVTCWSGEIEHNHGSWKAGFRGLKGELILGLEWRPGEWPHRWPH
ncbi:hypothetical protein IV102_09420 [bacterium]|nr:hypothetical protein [bacterium]